MPTEKVMVDIVFNPDTKQLEKKTTEITEKNKVKISFDKPDVKQLEGPFKELQEKAMAMANGGFSRGLGQLKEGVTEFGNIMKGGGDVSTAFAGGLSKIGMEGATAIGALAGVAAAGAAVGVGIYKFIDAGQEQARVQRQVNINLDEYAQTLHGVVDAQQILTLRTAALNAGVNLTAQQLSNVAVVSRNLGQETGNSAQSQQDYAEAIAGSVDAARRLGYQVDENATREERIRQVMQQITRDRAAQGAGAQTWGERTSEAWDKISRGASRAGAATDEFFTNLTSTQAQIDARAAAADARAERAAAVQRERTLTQAAADQLAGAGQQNAQRGLILAQQSVETARNGLSTQQQIAASYNETANIQAELIALGEVRTRTTEQENERVSRMTGLYGRLAAEEQKRNQLQTFSVQLADAQRERLVQQALAQVAGNGHSVRSLSLSEQLRMAEQKRLELIRLMALQGGVLTEEQQKQLADLQVFLNQGRAQQAQAASQEAATRRQNEQAELALRYANEEARARGEAYRLDVDAIDLTQRRSQLEAALNGLYAYRGRTASQEAARLAEIQRRTQELGQVRSIQEARAAENRRIDAETTARARKEEEARLAAIANANSFSDRRYAIGRSELAMYEEIAQRRREGVTLTQSETEFLARYNTVEAERVRLAKDLSSQIARAEADTKNGSLTMAERIAAQERLNNLRSAQINIDRRNQENERQRFAFTSRAGKAVEGLAGSYENLGDAMSGLAGGAIQNFGSAFGTLISTAIEGKTSFGEALQEMTKSVLASIAQQAGVQSLFQFATALGRAAIGDYKGAGEAAASGALFAAVAVAAGGVSAAIPAKKDSTAGGGGGTGPSDGGATGAGGGSGGSQGSSGPLVINFNVAPYSTKEDIEKGVAMAVYGYENRIGRNVRSTRR